MKALFKFIDIDEAIKRLQDIKKRNRNRVLICTIDFDNDMEMRRMATPDDGCVLVRDSRSVVLNQDEYISHIEVYSTEQNDIKRIIKRGIMHDIIFDQ